MRILITGANGFIAKNLIAHLNINHDFKLLTFNHENNEKELIDKLANADWVFHLAGVNRPKSESEYLTGNTNFTQRICKAIKSLNKKIPIVFTSSTQATLKNKYGISKKLAEKSLLKLKNDLGNPVFIYRLPNVFGKWSRPNYNSVVSTFCNNIANNLPIKINDPNTKLTLVYIDDVIKNFLKLLKIKKVRKDKEYFEIKPNYVITVGQLADLLLQFKSSRQTYYINSVGFGLKHHLYSTYLSYLPPNDFSYPIKEHCDSRGTFVEFVKTKNTGQVSFFSAKPGITRGGHYHHSKTEKFLVIKGKARFRFKHLVTNEYKELFCSDANYTIVETIPGWVHDVTNVGENELVCILWANEIFDKQNPDTFNYSLDLKS